MDGTRLYLDTASAAPVRREALEAAWPYLAGAFGNPSSHHEIGRISSEALADARSRVAKVLGMRSTDITFTSGGTEADNLAIIGMALGARARVGTRAGRQLRAGSARSRDGQPPRRHIGTVADVPALADIAHEAGALLHTDAVQAAGWLPLSGLGADALTLAGHKVGAPKGIGVAAIRARVPVEPLIHGGGQESGRRSGTENVALAIAFATALELAEAERAEAAARVRAIRDEFIAAVLAAVPGAFLTGSPDARTPNHASFCFPDTSGEAVLLELERLGVTASSGSACAVGSDEASHVLTALGIDDEVAQTSVRFTFPDSITDEQGRRAFEMLTTATSHLAQSYA